MLRKSPKQMLQAQPAGALSMTAARAHCFSFYPAMMGVAADVLLTGVAADVAADVPINDVAGHRGAQAAVCVESGAPGGCQRRRCRVGLHLATAISGSAGAEAALSMECSRRSGRRSGRAEASSLLSSRSSAPAGSLWMPSDVPTGMRPDQDWVAAKSNCHWSTVSVTLQVTWRVWGTRHDTLEAAKLP